MSPAKQILIFITQILGVVCFAQTNTIDSLKKLLPFTKETQQVNILNKISELYFQSGYSNDNFIPAKQYATKALQLSKQINYTKGTGVSFFNFGKVLSQNGYKGEDLHYAINIFNKAIPFLRESNENKMLGNCFELIAECTHELGYNQQAIHYYDSSIIAFQKIKDTSGIILSLGWKGHSYFDLGDYKTAYTIGQSAYELAQKTNDTLAQILTADHLANLFLGATMPETVLEHMRIITRFYPNTFIKKEFSSWEVYWGLMKAGEAYLQLGEIDSAMLVAQITGFYPGDDDQDMFLGHLYIAKAEYNKALPYFKDGYYLSSKSEHTISTARHANGLSRVYLAFEKYDSALHYANKAVQAAQSIHALLEWKNAISTLTDIYDKTNNYTQAYHFSQLYKSLSDSLAPEQYKRKLALIEIQNELANQKQHAQLLAKENQLQSQQNAFEKERARRMQTRVIIIISALIVIAVAVIMNIRLKRRKDQLEKKQLQQELELQTTESRRVEADFKVRLLELEMQALRAQMNPHFIFNCLSSVNRFILINRTEEASDYLTKFSRLIHMALHNSEKSYITLENELESLRLYLDLERLRFKNVFNYSISLVNTIDVSAVFIPPMLFQPFIENAIWHGLMHKQDGGFLDIELSIEEKILTCVITDNGIGRNNAAMINSKSAEKNKSMGVKITTERLALLNNNEDEQAVFDIKDLTDKEGNAAGTKVILKMKYRKLTDAFEHQKQ